MEQALSTQMDNIARDLNAALAADFPNAKLRHPVRQSGTAPVERSQLLLKQADATVADLKALASQLLGGVPLSAPTTSPAPVAGILPQIAELEDQVSQRMAEIRRLAALIRSAL